MSSAASALVVGEFLGGLRDEGPVETLPKATAYVAVEVGDGLRYRVEPGSLDASAYLTADLLLDGVHLAVFQLTLREGGHGPIFVVSFGLLNQCGARMRIPLSAADQKQWLLGREGAWLKPLCWGDAVDVARVDRIELTVHRKGPDPVRWSMSPLCMAPDAPPLLDKPLLPRGPLLDELGQSTLHDWPSKTRSVAEASGRLRRQLAAAGDARWPAGYSSWGGWAAGRRAATGYFRAEHDGRRWWLVDPAGHLFWSSGPNCVQGVVDSTCTGLEAALEWTPHRAGPYADAIRTGRNGSLVVNYLGTNLIRAFGMGGWWSAWSELALATLRRAGFNTVANWSDWEIARAAGFPYVRPLQPRWRRTPTVYRDFPDVFHPGFATDAETFAEQLRDTAEDPALIGYFLMNEPTWGFATETPAAGMVRSPGNSATRRELVGWLADRYGDDAGLSARWGGKASLTAIGERPWSGALTTEAEQDLADFSAVMVAKLFDTLSRACRAVDPHHLNLGARYYTVPPAWALAGMASFDVFSMNCYRERVPAADLAKVSDALGRPILIGEWHFGALDAGLPASGIGHVPDQAARGQAFRVYLEDAAAQPWCVGAHYFTLYDQSAIGRFDGENYNIGLVDICHREYEPLVAAARESHAAMYPVALGQREAYAREPEYLPKLFL
ncbi:hypothetical protein ABN034_01480 [Actinopolymorpha sp. B11F2]|uniref:hypothetical protein n=1 Tax=Actinopolymorpha sp. B11F2 TaxID=3160862 RepID=UPI0032E398A2